MLRMMTYRRPLIVMIALFALYFVPYAVRGHFPPSGATNAQSEEINVLDYGAVGDGVADDGAAFVAAFAAAVAQGKSVVIPGRKYLVNSPIEIKSGMLIISHHATLFHSSGMANIFYAVGADDWVIQGPLTLAGTMTAPGQKDVESGLSITGCKRYVVDKLTVRNFKGSGISILPGPLSADRWKPRGDMGKFAFISFIDNAVGLDIAAGTGAEYNLFTLLSFSGNAIAANIAGGNTIISASNIVDNDNGVQLSDGPNHGHGIFSAVNINHNTGFNVRADKVVNGYTFDGCHIYGGESSSGAIHLRDSQGVHFNSGMIDSAIINDGGQLNAASGNYSAGPNFRLCGMSPQSFQAGNNFDEHGLFTPLSGAEACAKLP